MKKHLPLLLPTLVIGWLCLSTTTTILAQGTAFTYQGKLTDSGNLANGNYDFQFKLFDALSAGTQLGTTQSLSPVSVSNGIFSVPLDFGACPTCFNGAARFLEIAVRPTGGGSFMTLSPRQPITSSPYALKSQNATTADGLSVACVNCVTSSHIQSVNGSAVTGTIPVSSVPAGSTNYIQNGTSQQASSNFNISGSGTANILNATMQYNLNGLRAFTINGAYDNGAGMSFTATNTFAGEGAGVNTTPSPTLNNDAGKFNSFYGVGAGQANTIGNFNAFFGYLAGLLNTTGDSNAFFGRQAGINNTTGTDNAFFGRDAGFFNTTGTNNASFGRGAGRNNTTGSQNTLIGNFADVGSGNLFNATAIGSRAQVSQSNSLVLGALNGVNNCTAVTDCDSVKVGIGTTAPDALLDVQRDGNTIPETARFTTFGADNKTLSRAAGGTRANPAATPNGTLLLQLGATGHNGNGFVTAPRAAIEMTAAEAWAAGATGTLMRFNTTLSGTTQILTRMTIADDGNVGIGTASPADLLHVNGIIRVATLGGAGSTSLCRNASNQIATCSSSLRYKTAIQPFSAGLEIIKRLRPISFTWRQSGSRDLGFAAEEVAKVEPLFTFTNDKGEVEGVKYDRLSVVLVNAVKELKQENDQLKQQLTAQQQEMAVIKKLLCASQPQADLCKAKSLK